MKSNASSWFPGAGAAAWLFLAACQQPDSPALTAPSGPEAPAAAASESAVMRPAGPGRKPSEEELARILAMSRHSPAPGTGSTPAPLAKTSAVLQACFVNFNSSTGLGNLPDHANMGYAFAPYYRHTCNTSYTAIGSPIGSPAYRLTPERSGWCPGTSPNIGTYAGSADCTNQTQGKYWSRRFGNDVDANGVSFTVTNATHFRNFDLRTLYVHSGTVEVWGYTPSGSWVTWSGLTAGTTWLFPPSTTLGQLQVFESGRNGRFLADNLEIAIHP